MQKVVHASLAQKLRADFDESARLYFAPVTAVFREFRHVWDQPIVHVEKLPEVRLNGFNSENHAVDEQPVSKKRAGIFR